MLSKSEIEALFTLLDDTDEDVVQAVEARLYSQGIEMVPVLEELWGNNADPVRAFRIENIIRGLQHEALISDFDKWKSDPEAELLEACILISKIQYPGLVEKTVYNYIDKLRIDVWMALYNANNPYDKVQVLNHILFERHGLDGNTSQYHSVDNSLINRVIETRKGNPITLSALYAIIAQKLGIPVFGVNLPQHFVLAYCDDSETDNETSFHEKRKLKRSDYGHVLFYINPFSRGQIFLKKNIDEFLEAVKIPARQEFYEPCSNKEIVKRMLRNLHYAYSEIHNEAKRQQVEDYMRVFDMLGELPGSNGINPDLSI